MLVSSDRKSKQLLATGERKSITTDRVILVLGSAKEIATVREIFRMFTAERMSLRAISIELNNRKVPSPMNANWTHSVVRTLVHTRSTLGATCSIKQHLPLEVPRFADPEKSGSFALALTKA